jgi:hypothetical protein
MTCHVITQKALFPVLFLVPCHRSSGLTVTIFRACGEGPLLVDSHPDDRLHVVFSALGRWVVGSNCFLKISCTGVILQPSDTLQTLGRVKNEQSAISECTHVARM